MQMVPLRLLYVYDPLFANFCDEYQVKSLSVEERRGIWDNLAQFLEVNLVAGIRGLFTGLQSLNPIFRMRISLLSAGLEYYIKFYLSSLKNNIGLKKTVIFHNWADYPQTLMAGVIASRFFNHPQISRSILVGFAVIPVVCKVLGSFNIPESTVIAVFESKRVKSRFTVAQGIDHAFRLAGKTIFAMEKGRTVYKNFDPITGISFLLAAFFAAKDFNNTREYIINTKNHNYYLWNINYFGESLI